MNTDIISYIVYNPIIPLYLLRVFHYYYYYYVPGSVDGGARFSSRGERRRSYKYAYYTFIIITINIITIITIIITITITITITTITKPYTGDECMNVGIRPKAGGIRI